MRKLSFVFTIYFKCILTGLSVSEAQIYYSSCFKTVSGGRMFTKKFNINFICEDFEYKMEVYGFRKLEKKIIMGMRISLLSFKVE